MSFGYFYLFRAVSLFFRWRNDCDTMRAGIDGAEVVVELAAFDGGKRMAGTAFYFHDAFHQETAKKEFTTLLAAVIPQNCRHSLYTIYSG